MKKKDLKYMNLALELAARARERTYPNPMVGAVIVKRGRIVGRGYHRRAGLAHAEVEAIRAAGPKCAGAEMYVTLEPCDHHGRTPPCTRAIIRSGIKSVVIAMKDPNPLASGKGIRKLKKAGIPVRLGPCSSEAARLNRKYIKYITSGMPYVAVKIAQSIDGKTAARNGTSKWISSAPSRKFARSLRSGSDAVIVGINTVLADDPFLLDGKRGPCAFSRVIVDSRLRTPLESNIIKTRNRSPVIIAATGLAPASRIKKFSALDNVKVIKFRARKGRVPLKAMLRRLAREEMVSVFAEGGGALLGSLLDGSLIDEVLVFIAPKVIGGPYSSVKGLGASDISRALDLEDILLARSGDDVFIRGLIRKK